MRTLLIILLLTTSAYASVITLVFYTQDQYVFFPSKVMTATPRQAGLNYEDVRLQTRDGINLHGWFLSAANARSTLLFLHGNGGNISHRLESLKIFNRLGMSVFIIDYRGYGLSEGKPSEKGTYIDADTAWNYLRKTRGIPADKIIIFGRSLGGAVATWLASYVTPQALILESTFRSIASMGSERFPWLPVSLMTRIHYNTELRIPHVSVPILIAHSPDDEVVPYDQGVALAKKSTSPTTFLRLKGDHNSGFLETGAKYRDALKEFFESVQKNDKNIKTF